MKQSSSPIANPVAVLREEFDDWAVLFNPDTAEAVGINPVGVAVWKLMDGRRSVEEIIREISDQFDKVPSTVGEEVSAFVAQLTERGFVGSEVENTGQ
jgi:SynChlorMet cassette protein ScmD